MVSLLSSALEIVWILLLILMFVGELAVNLIFLLGELLVKLILGNEVDPLLGVEAS